MGYEKVWNMLIILTYFFPPNALYSKNSYGIACIVAI